MKRGIPDAKRRVSTGSPVQVTLDILQKRLDDAEGQAKALGNHLERFGFKRRQDKEVALREGKGRDRTSPKNSKGKDQLKSKNQERIIHRNFEEMATRVSKMEQMIHSLKTGMHGLEERQGSKLGINEEGTNRLKESHIKEVKRLEDRISRLNKESEELRDDNEKFQAEIGKFIEELREMEVSWEDDKAKGVKLEAKVEKLTIQRDEVSDQLEREISLRQSLEEAHEALLKRVHDMESVVDAERNQVNELLSNWDNTRQQEAATKEAFENEHDLRMQLEALTTQQEQEFDLCREKLNIVSEDNKRLSSDLSKTMKEANSLRNQLEMTTKSNAEIKRAYDTLLKDSKKLREALSIAATDNKALIAQHKDAMQREKVAVNAQLAAQDQMLDNAKDAILKELDRQKAILRKTEQDNQDLKAKIRTTEKELDLKNEEITSLKRKHESEIVQLNFTIDSLKKDNEMNIKESNQRISSLQNTNEELHRDVSSKQYEITRLISELQRCESTAKATENENVKLATRLSSAENAQLSQKQIEEAMNEMMTAKNKLAYDKGMLQSKVDQLSLEISSLSAVKMENEGLKEKCQELQNCYNKVVIELQSSEAKLNEYSTELTNYKATIERKDADLTGLVKSREHGLKEVQKLLSHIRSTEDKYNNQILALQSSLEVAQNEKKSAAQSFQSIMQSHSKLQTSYEDLQTRLGRKDSEITNLLNERLSVQNVVNGLQDEMTSLQNKITELQDQDSIELEELRNAMLKLQNEKKLLKKSIEVLKTEKTKLKEEISDKEAHFNSKIEQLTKERKYKEDHCLEERENEREELKEKIEEEVKQNNKLTKQLHVLEKNFKATEQARLSIDTKFKKLKESFRQKKRELVSCQYENHQQADTIAELSAHIRDLQAELRAADDLQMQSGVSYRHIEDEIAEEKHRRLEAESQCMALQSREKELVCQLKDASRANAKISCDLKEAQSWFQKKVSKLEKELHSAKQTQFILEQTVSEQEKLTELERSKSEEAKNIVKASRMAVNKLANDVQENLWETKGLKHVIQAEQGYGVMAAQKYGRLVESSARKVEELTRELDRAHDKARKAR
eukprot:gene15081-16637_t